MSIITDTLLSKVNDLLQNTRIVVEPLPKAARNPDGFYARKLPTGSQIITMPEWYIEDWHRGFGGWVISSGRTVRYVRHQLSHRNLYTAIAQVNQRAEPDERGRREDMRTQDVEDWIREELLPQESFYFQDIEEQLAVVIAGSLLNVGAGRTKEAKYKGVNSVKKAVSEFMNSFQPVRGRIEDENTNLTKYLQYTCRMGYPETGLPGGVSGFFRNAFVNHMVQMTDLYGGVRNLWDEGPFRAVVACTGKSVAGEWVTLIPPVAFRADAQGVVQERTDLKTPLMIAGISPIGYNPKRHFREGNAVARGQKLLNPRPITQGMMNGYEHNIGPDLEARRTEVCVCIGGLVGINLYPDPNNPGEYLNLDDIILTPEGQEALRAEYRQEWEFTGEEWQMRSADFCKEDGKTPRDGYSFEPRIVRCTSVQGNDLFSADMVVKGPIEPDPDIVGKAFVESLKAMAKTIRSRLIGVDKAGREYEIDLVISGHSIIEKKLPFIPLQAMASRAGIRYWEDFENPIHPKRKQRKAGEDYVKWACGYPDLVRATYLALLKQKEETNGTIDIYSVTDTLNGDAPVRQYVGKGVVGWTRASRLYESERTGTKARKRDSMPYGTYIRILANVQLKKDPEVLRQFNMAAEIRRNLAQFANIEDNGEDMPFDAETGFSPD